jgi:Plasmid replication protein.
MPTSLTEKSRNYGFVVYPHVSNTDGAPEDWRDILDDMHVSWIESPLHDKDVNPDGEIKKAHWHVLVVFDGPQRMTAAENIAQKLNSPKPQIVKSAKGLVRYMIHMDNPEKYQYSKSEIIGHGGADVESYFEMSVTNQTKVLKDISQYVIENKVTDFADLVMYSIQTSDEWFEVVSMKSSLYLSKLTDSMWKKFHKELKNEDE